MTAKELEAIHHKYELWDALGVTQTVVWRDVSALLDYIHELEKRLEALRVAWPQEAPHTNDAPEF